MKLYELTEAYNNLLDLDINSEELKPHLDILEDEIEIKAENIAKVIKSLDAEAKAYKEEADRLTENKRALENRSKTLKSYLEGQMILVDKKKFKSGLFSFNIQKNPTSVRILDESKLPDDYFVIERKPIKSDIKKALENGLLTDAAELVQSESLRIR